MKDSLQAPHAVHVVGRWGRSRPWAGPGGRNLVSPCGRRSSFSAATGPT